MRLTWKDAVATVIVAGAVALYLAHLDGADLAFLSGVRVLAPVILVLGFAAFVAAAQVPEQTSRANNRWLNLFGILGLVSAIAAVGAMISAGAAFLAVLVGCIALMWILATTRHAIGPPRGRA
jgi:hypothetical protein